MCARVRVCVCVCVWMWGVYARESECVRSGTAAIIVAVHCDTFGLAGCSCCAGQQVTTGTRQMALVMHVLVIARDCSGY